MSDFKQLFQSFSRRPQPEAPAPKALTATFRNRVIMLLFERVSLSAAAMFWQQMHSKLAYLYGTPRLTQGTGHISHKDDVVGFVQQCSDEHFLDLVELVFSVGQSMFLGVEQILADFNQFLLVDALPYSITNYVREERLSRPQSGPPRMFTTITAYPQVIRTDSRVLHITAVEPTLQLLSDKAFSGANAEFLGALADYRHGRYDDCLTKCGSAFESVLKVICTRKGWAYNQTDTAAPLIHAVVTNSGMESFFETPLVLIATIRNRLSSAHGTGVQSRSVSQAKAEYGLNAAASAILLLVKETA